MAKISDEDIKKLMDFNRLKLSAEKMDYKGLPLDKLSVEEDVYRNLTDANKFAFYTNVLFPAFKKGNLSVVNQKDAKGKMKEYFVIYTNPENPDAKRYSMESKMLYDTYGHMLEEYLGEHINNLKTYYSDERPDVSSIIKALNEHLPEAEKYYGEDDEELMMTGFIHQCIVDIIYQNYTVETSDLEETKFGKIMKENLNEFKRMLSKNEDLREKFLILPEELLREMDLPVFKYLFLRDFSDTKLIDIDKLERKGILEDIKNEEMLDLLGPVFDKEQFCRIMGPIRLQDYISKLASSEDRYDKRDLKKVLENAPKGFILRDILFNRIVPINDLKRYIQKSDVFALDTTYLMFVLDEYKKEFGITDTDILNEYGKRLGGQDIIHLLQIGHVPIERMIELSINKSLEITDPEKVIPKEAFLELYNAEALLDMKNRNKINDKFIKLFNENIIEGLDDGAVKEYYSNFVDDLEYISGSNIEFKNNIFDFYNLNFLNGEHVANIIDEKYLNNIELDEEILIRLFNDKIISTDFIKNYLSVERILELVDNDLSIEALKILSEEELTDALLNGEISFESIMKVYLETDKISIEDLKILIELVEVEDDLALYINENSRIERIEELFSNYLIDFEGLNNLRKLGIIDEESYNKLKDVISANEFYNKLEDTRVIRLRAQTEDMEVAHTGSRIKRASKKQSNIDFDLEEDMLKTLLDISNIDDVPIIESIDDNGNYTSLNGYKAIPIRKHGLVILEKFEAENSMFVMPYQQAAYFLNETNSQSKRKRVIKEMDQVKVIVHSANFAKNAMDAVCELSDSAREDLKPKRRYIKEAAEYIETMKEEYYKNKERRRGE